MSAHRRCQAFRGESTDDKDMLFSVRKLTFFQMKNQVGVFMPSNANEDVSDFRIEGSWFESWKLG
ncbi:hypothetical protein ABFX02_10G031500 [Erythranthe guttata]